MPHWFIRSLVAEDVLEETDAHIIKAKNSPVPVQVQEVLRHDSSGIYKVARQPY